MSRLPPPSATLLTEPPRGAGVPAIELPPLSDLSLAAPPRSPGRPAVAMPKPSGAPRADPSDIQEPTADESALRSQVRTTDPSAVTPVRPQAEAAAVDQDIAELMAAPLLHRQQAADQHTEHGLEARRSAEQERRAADAEWRAFEAEWDADDGDLPVVEDAHVVERSESPASADAGPDSTAAGSALSVAQPHASSGALLDLVDVAGDSQNEALGPRSGGRRRALRLTGVLSLVGIAFVAWFVIPVVADRVSGDDEAIETTVADAGAIAGETGEVADDPAAGSGAVDGEQGSAAPSVAPESADVIVPVPADVDDVWLLDRGDGRYDWGAVVVSTADDVRNDLDIVATLLDADGRTVHVEEFRIVDLGPGGSGFAGGVFEALDVEPVRLELVATAAVSEPDARSGGDDPADDGTGAGIEYRVSDVRRIASGQVDRDDRLLGSIEVVASGVDDAVEPLDGSVTVLRLAALWRDDAGAVVAAVLDEFEPIEGVDPVDGVSTLDFSLGLARAVVPPGLPDDVVVSVGT